jgi:glucosylglycerol-phosphate synthase
MIFAASRVDYIKGITELLECYERILLGNNNTDQKTVLYLVAVQPAEGMTIYADLMGKICALVGRINGKFSTLYYSPVVFITNSLSFKSMLAYMHVADIMWVTSLRDGMNIICEEFIATKKEKTGVLVLSEFAGASVLLEEALLTNPFVNTSMDETLLTALTMSEKEKRERMDRLYKKIRISDIKIWSKQLCSLYQSPTGEAPSAFFPDNKDHTLETPANLQISA